MTLPVDAILPALKATLLKGLNAVMQAPPGAGKTTGVPPALLGETWLQKRKIVLLQPRRLAARAAARRMADRLGETVGRQVGYRIRFDKQVSRQTRIEVVTEALLTRKLQRDPELADTGLVIFDEFHERSLHSDLGLALCREVQTELRPDLRLLVMSATLEGEAVARILGNCDVLTCHGRQHPVETRYLDKPVPSPTPAFIALEIKRILEKEVGSLLAFLPGAGEILRVKAQLEKRQLPSNVKIAPLYGDLPGKMQDLAIQPSQTGQRKVVLATSIAETSLTIEGIHIVVDAGLMRIPRFHPGSLMTVLETVRVSKASADQRRGRAGRTGPGICYRFWTEHDHRSLVPFNKPEIVNTDLSPLALELACWGPVRMDAMAWLDAPPVPSMKRGWELLQTLGAVDGNRRITRHGRRLNRLGVHPRLGHMILKGAALAAGPLAADMAALISSRDILPRTGQRGDVDIRTRLEIMRKAASATHPAGRQPAIKQPAVSRARQLSKRWQKMAGGFGRGDQRLDESGKILALAYPDRVGKLRAGGRNRYVLSSGHGAILPECDPLCGTPFIVAARTDGKPHNARIFLAAGVTAAALEDTLGAQISTRDLIGWDSRRQVVVCRRQQLLGKVALRDKDLINPDMEMVCDCLLKGIHEAGIDCLPLSRDDHNWIARVQFVRTHSRESDPWPDLSDQALLQNLATWLRPQVIGLRSLAALKKLNMSKILGSQLTWRQRERLERLAPVALKVPSGSRIRLQYEPGKIPVLSVRLQEVYGLRTTPTVLEGKVQVLLHLLSPAGRPVQVTRDLEGFWKGVYSDVRKEMRGRYPKHYWPENPLKAVATSRVRPKLK